MTDVSAPRSIDILDPRLYDDPWDTYAWLRTHDPIHWDAKNELWVVSRHEDVSHISRHQERYCAGEGVRPVIAAPMSIISMDDPEHTRQRRIISKGFTPRKVREITEHIREVSNDIIDQVAQRGELDFVEDFAIHVPLIVIAEMLGLDPSTREKLYRWSDAMMEGDGHLDPTSPALVAAAEAFGEYATVCAELIADRRENPVDDIISILTGAYDEGDLTTDSQGLPIIHGADDLNDEELIMFLVLLVVAGNETTRNALSGGLHAFTRFPDQKAKLIANPDLIDSAVDEIVRYVSPVISFCRTVTEDHTYKGVDFKTGDKILMLYQSANRDSAVFADPDEFIIDRSPNPHLGFGIGTHFCLGANLAKAEIKVVFQELFRRLPDIEVADPNAEIPRGESSLVISIAHLPAIFTPEQTYPEPART